MPRLLQQGVWSMLFARQAKVMLAHGAQTIRSGTSVKSAFTGSHIFSKHVRWHRNDGNTGLLAGNSTLQRKGTDSHTGQARAVIVVGTHGDRVHRERCQIGQDGRRLVGGHLKRHQPARLRVRRIRQKVLIERKQPCGVDLNFTVDASFSGACQLTCSERSVSGSTDTDCGSEGSRWMLSRMHWRPGSVCCTQDTRDLSRSVNGVYSPRHMSWQRSGMPFSTQHGTWLRPSAMQRTMFGKSRSHCSGSAPADPSSMLCSTQKPMQPSDTFGTPSGLTSSSESTYMSDESSSSEVAPSGAEVGWFGADVLESVAFRLVAVFFFG
uniref:Uncharacterized protein n=1 Tax=Anopheles farauti TaxID=69004 RepID=A0A182Q381_9DIPT